MQSIDSIGTYGYRTSKDPVCKRKGTKCNSFIKSFKND